MMQAGTTLQQRYRIDKQIGQGGMGAVYVATDERFGSIVAIKETLCMDDNFRKAIEREARLLNSLKHSALPRVSDHFLESDGQFLVMEYIQGEDLCYMIANSVVLPTLSKHRTNFIQKKERFKPLRKIKFYPIHHIRLPGSDLGNARSYDLIYRELIVDKFQMKRYTALICLAVSNDRHRIKIKLRTSKFDLVANTRNE